MFQCGKVDHICILEQRHGLPYGVDICKGLERVGKDRKLDRVRKSLSVVTSGEKR